MALGAEPCAEELAATRADREAFVRYLMEPLLGRQRIGNSTGIQ